MSLLCEFEGCIATFTVHHSAAMSLVGTYHNGIRLFRSHPSQPSNNPHSLNRIEALAQTVHLQPLEAEDAICSSCFLPTESSASLPPVDSLSVPQQDRRLKDDCDAFGRIAIGTASGSLHVVDVGTKAALHSIMCFPSQPMHTVLPMMGRSNPNVILAASSSQVAMVDLVSASATAELTLPERRCAAVVVLSPSHIAVAQGNEVVTLFDLRQSHDTPVSHFVVAPQSQVTALACDEHGTLAAGTAEGRIAVFRALHESCAAEEKFAASASVVSMGTADRSPIRSLSITNHGKHIGAVDQLGAGVLIANRNATVHDEEEEPSSSSNNALWSRRHYQSSDFLPPSASNLVTKDQGGEGRPFLKHLVVEEPPLKSTQKQTVLVRATIVDDVRGTSWYSERMVTTAQ